MLSIFYLKHVEIYIFFYSILALTLDLLTLKSLQKSLQEIRLAGAFSVISHNFVRNSLINIVTIAASERCILDCILSALDASLRDL